MQTEKNSPSEKDTRRKLIAGLGILSLFPILKFEFTSNKKEVISCAPEVKKLRMLTQDGMLVEVDANKIINTKDKISNKALQSWVKKEL